MSAAARRLRPVLVAGLCLVLGALGAMAQTICGGRDLLAGPDGAALAARVAAVARPANGDAVFWRVTSPDAAVAPSWLLGTIHLTDPRVATPSAAAAAALAGARVLAVENRTALSPERDPAAMQRFLRLAVYGDGRSLSGVLDTAELTALGAALNGRGLPSRVFLGWKPWAVVVAALTYPPCEMRRLTAGVKFLDAALLARAEAAGTPIADLEDFATQLGSIAAVPDDAQAAMLRASLKLEPMQIDLHETMIGLYRAGRIGDLIALSKLLAADAVPGADFAPFWHGLLDARNAGMVAAAARLTGEGGAFIAAGAGHLIGDTGLVAGLRRAGFRVEPVR